MQRMQSGDSVRHAERQHMRAMAHFAFAADLYSVNTLTLCIPSFHHRALARALGARTIRNAWLCAFTARCQGLSRRWRTHHLDGILYLGVYSLAVQ